MALAEIEELELARTEFTNEILTVIARLAAAKYHLTTAQRVVIAEELRNVADAFDRGASERLRRRIALGRYELITNAGPNGRPLFRLAG